MRRRSKLLVIVVVAMGVGFLDEPGSGYGMLRIAQQEHDWNVPAEAKTLKNPVAGDEHMVERGRKLFRTWCAMCHGDKGRGDGMVANSLEPKPTDLTKVIKNQSDGELFWKITKGKLPMPGFEVTLSEKDRWAVVAFLRRGL